jgi:hypothetical protein
MSQKEKFPELDIDQIRYCAKEWAKIYPCIEQIVLYRAGHDYATIDYQDPPSEEDRRLGLKVAIEEEDADYQVQYIIAVTVPLKPSSRGKKDGMPYLAFEYKGIEGGVGIGNLPKNKFSVESSLERPKYKNNILENVKLEYQTFSAKAALKAKNAHDRLADEAITQHPELESILDYYGWIERGNLPCDHIGKHIPGFYNTKEAPLYFNIQYHWLWLSIAPGEDILDHNDEDVDSFIKGNEKEELYSSGLEEKIGLSIECPQELKPSHQELNDSNKHDINISTFGVVFWHFLKFKYLIYKNN